MLFFLAILNSNKICYTYNVMIMNYMDIDCVYIEPMNKENEEFIGKDYLAVQTDYFDNDLVNSYDYLYYFDIKGIRQEMNNYDVLILFQFDRYIIASAILSHVEHFPDDYVRNHPECKGHNGRYVLKKDTVRTFKPITADEIGTMIKDFKRFGDVRQSYLKYQIDMNSLLSRISIKK